MRVAFDTSVVVAGLVAGHEHHTVAAPWLRAVTAKAVEGAMGLHAIAESWAVLTRLPSVPRLTGSAASLMLASVRAHVTRLPPSEATYLAALERCVDRGVFSGAVFDALHVVTAERWPADVILTFNAEHFRRLSVPGGPRVVVPSGTGDGRPPST